MNKVFVSSKKKPQTKLFRGFGGKSKQQEDVSDTHTEYFPFSGGGGIDSFEFSPNFMSYEPQDTMVDTNVTLDKEDGFKLKKHIQKILVKGSKYEILEPELDTDSHHFDANTDSSSGTNSPNIVNSAPATSYHTPIIPKAIPGTANTSSTSKDIASSGDSSLTWCLDLLEDFSLDHDHVVGFIRQLAKKSVVLMPLDQLADKFSDISLAVDTIACLELLVLMLLCDRVALLVRFLCSPAVLIAHFLFSIL